ncbi:hypothetical protein O1M63_28185 [Streptomyces mirabilis]|nr:hypothetical protein [Streptomyces mirabilis]
MRGPIQQRGVGGQRVQRTRDLSGAPAQTGVEAVVCGQFGTGARIVDQLEGDQQRLLVGTEEGRPRERVVTGACGERLEREEALEAAAGVLQGRSAELLDEDPVAGGGRSGPVVIAADVRGQLVGLERAEAEPIEQPRHLGRLVEGEGIVTGPGLLGFPECRSIVICHAAEC